MQLTGNDFIDALKNEAVVTKTFTAADQESIVLDDLFDFVTKTLMAGQLVAGEMVISGDEPISLRLESSLINLPLRYVNAISKIVINDPDTEVTLYMIVEHPKVTQSGLRIDAAATVAAYLDDPDSVKVKIANYFTDEIVKINSAVAAGDAEEDAAE
jgi:hypothetical protein